MNRSLEMNVRTEEAVESEFEEIYYEREEYFKRFNLQEVCVLYRNHNLAKNINNRYFFMIIDYENNYED